MIYRLKERVRYQSYGPLGGKYAFMGYKGSSYWRLVRDDAGKPLTFKSEQDAFKQGARTFGTTADFKVEAA